MWRTRWACWSVLEASCQQVVVNGTSVQTSVLCCRSTSWQELPKHKKTMLPTSKWCNARVCHAFEDPATLAYLNFVAYIASFVRPFLLIPEQRTCCLQTVPESVWFGETVTPDVVVEKWCNLTAVYCEQSKIWLESGKMTIRRRLFGIINRIKLFFNQSMFENHYCLPTTMPSHK